MRGRTASGWIATAGWTGGPAALQTSLCPAISSASSTSMRVIEPCSRALYGRAIAGRHASSLYVDSVRTKAALPNESKQNAFARCFEDVLSRAQALKLCDYLGVVTIHSADDASIASFRTPTSRFNLTEPLRCHNGCRTWR